MFGTTTARRRTTIIIAASTGLAAIAIGAVGAWWLIPAGHSHAKGNAKLHQVEAWCAHNLPAACVTPSDRVVHIPSGRAMETLNAYFAIQSNLRDALQIEHYIVDPGNNENADKLQTPEVHGQFSATQTLNRLLAGGELDWTQRPAENGGISIWVFPRKSAAPQKDIAK